MNIQGIISVVICVTATGPSLAIADRYESPSGYTFNVPKGWLAADAEAREEVAREAKLFLTILGDVDFEVTDVVVFDPQEDGFADNFNVGVHDGRIPVKEKFREQFGRDLRDNYVKTGLQPKAFTSEIRTVGENKCLIFTFNVEMRGARLWMRQYMIPGKDVTYIVTCTTLADHQDAYAVQFEEVMKSFTVVGGTPGSWDSLTDIVKSTIIGAVIGAVVLGGGSLAFERIKRTMKPKGTEVSDAEHD